MDTKTSTISDDPKQRKDIVNKGAVYLKPKPYQIMQETHEMLQALYLKKYGKKFVSSRAKKQDDIV